MHTNFVARMIGLSVVLALACGKDRGRTTGASTGPYRLAGVEVHVADANLSPDAAAEFEATARRAFLRSTNFAVVGRDSVSAEVWAAVSRETGQAEILMRVGVPPGLQPALGDKFAEAYLGMPTSSGWDVLIGRGVAAIDAQLRLAAGEPGVVAELLRSDDPHLLVIAMEWIRRQTDARWVEQVTQLLRHPEPQVSRLAVEVIGELGGPEHASALVRHVRLADPGHAHRTYAALASLGGPEAEGFLRFAAENEDEPERRQAARLALERLVRSTSPSQRRTKDLRGHRR